MRTTRFISGYVMLIAACGMLAASAMTIHPLHPDFARFIRECMVIELLFLLFGFGVLVTSLINVPWHQVYESRWFNRLYMVFAVVVSLLTALCTGG